MELAKKKNACLELLLSCFYSLTAMNLFSPPSLDDLIRLLKAWKFWVLGAILGAILGALTYLIVPPPYQARATVVVDFNLEDALPAETDRQHFYYLEREVRKLEEIAWSDDVMQKLSTEFGISVGHLRGGALALSQPADGGWHFYANDANAELASRLASAWTNGFAEEARQRIASGELNSFIQVEVAQSAGLPVERSAPLSTYLLIGAICFLAVSAMGIMFFSRSP